MSSIIDLYFCQREFTARTPLSSCPLLCGDNLHTAGMGGGCRHRMHHRGRTRSSRGARSSRRTRSSRGRDGHDCWLASASRRNHHGLSSRLHQDHKAGMDLARQPSQDRQYNIQPKGQVEPTSLQPHGQRRQQETKDDLANVNELDSHSIVQTTSRPSNNKWAGKQATFHNNPNWVATDYRWCEAQPARLLLLVSIPLIASPRCALYLLA